MSIALSKRRSATAIAALLLVATACTSTGTDVVFDEQTLSTEAPEPTATTVDDADSLVATTQASTTTTQASTSSTPALDLSAETLESLPARLAIGGPSRTSVSVLGPDLTEELVETSEFAGQPTWSPDGSRVAWSLTTADGSWGIVISPLDGGDRQAIATPYVPFYIQWRPDGEALALLGATAGGTGMIIIDLSNETARTLHSADSFYFHWSPDGRSMISHMDSSRLELIDVESGVITPIDTETSTFLAPAWAGDSDSILYVRPSVGATASLLAQAGPIDELIRYDVASGESQVIARAAGIQSFALSPSGGSLAYSTPVFGPDQVIRIVDLRTEDVEEFAAPNLFAWQWSPDSQKILTLEVVERTLEYGVWMDGDTTDYAAVLPTSTFVSRYLAFWGQYDLSVDLWSPDSSSFIYAAVDRGADWILIQRLEDELPIPIRQGGVAFFSPVG